MAFIQEYNFRSTLGYDTDVAPAIWVDHTAGPPYASQVHPVDGNLYGWDQNSVLGNIQARNRNAGLDARLAGWEGVDSSDPGVDFTKFFVALPSAGDYKISLAIGDASYACADLNWRILDNTTPLSTYTNKDTSAGEHFYDAAGTEHASAAAWVSSNASITLTFATTSFFLEIGASGASSFSRVAHLRIEKIDASSNIGPTAFQGFQTNAFQGQGGHLKKRIDTAFQTNAFQSNAFQIYGSNVASAPSDITAAGTLSITGAAALHSYGKVAATGALSITGAAALHSYGKLTAAGTLSITGAADLDARGKLTAAGTLSITGAADLDARGKLAATGTLSITGAANLTQASAADMHADGTISIVGAGSLTAYGALLVDGTILISGSADLGPPAAVAADQTGGSGPDTYRHRLLEEDRIVLRVITEYFGITDIR